MVIVLPLLVAYLVMFGVVAIYANRTGRSVPWWLLLSVVLTPVIAFIILRGNELQKRRAASQRISERPHH